MLMSVLGISAQKSWIFSDAAFLGEASTVEFTEETTINGLTIVPAAEGTEAGKGVVIDANNKTVDGVKYTHRLKTGGTATATNRLLRFAVDGPTKITVVLMSGSGSNNRTLNICKDAYDKDNPIGTMPALGATCEKVSYNYTGEAATIVLGSHSSGINIYAIYTEPLTIYSIVGDFSGGWDNDIDMVESEDDPNVYTLTIENFNVDKDFYEYKLRTNHAWGGYELPGDGTNQNWKFDNADYPHGLYNLTFTANIAENTLELVPVMAPPPTSIDINVTDELTDGTKNYMTFSSPYALDFTGLEGIKAYTAKKNIVYDSANGVDASEVIMTPIEQVPANTGILIKADEATTYTVPVINETLPAVADNDLLVAAEKTDLFPLIDGYNKGIGTLTHIVKDIYDGWTGKTTHIDEIAFAPLPVPAEEGVNFLEKGDAYLSFNYDELDQMGYNNDFAKLVFTDAETPVVESIAALLALENGTEATLKLAENTVVTFVGSEGSIIQDATGGLVLSTITLPAQAGDVVTGEITGTFDKETLFPALQKSTLTDLTTVVVDGTAEVEAPVVTLEEAFADEHIMRLVTLQNVNVTVKEEGYSTEVTFADENGTELVINDLLGACTFDILNLKTGDVLKEVKGYAYTIPEGSFYEFFYDTYQFQPISIEKLHTYAIVGDFFTTDEVDGWENDQEMTVSPDDENIYTLVVENFEVVIPEGETTRKYEYKMRADQQWNVYDLPLTGNQDFVFGTPEYPAGKYNLTFTANLTTNELTLDVESAEIPEDLFVNIAAMKAYEGDAATKRLKLTNAKVTYSKVFVEDYNGSEYVNDNAVIEDESGALLFTQCGLAAAFPTGTILNGTIELDVASMWGSLTINLTANTEADIAALEATPGTAEPLLVTEDNVDAYAEDFDWRLAKFENVTYSEGSGDPTLTIPVLGNSYGVQDTFGAIEKWPAEGEVVDAVGYIYDFFGGLLQIFQPIEFIPAEEKQVAVITFGNADPGRDYISDPFMVNGVTNLETDLVDGTHMLFNFTSEGNPNGKFWAAGIAGEWNNAAAVAEMNTALNTGFENSDFAAGSPLQATNPGPGDSHANLILTFNEPAKKTLELYVTMTGRNGPLDAVTVTGLDSYSISYAVGDGDGFVSEPTFSQEVLGVTLIKIKGYLIDGQSVTVTSLSMAGENSAKSGFQMAGYTFTDEELPFVINSMAVVGTFPGMTWEPTQGIAMTQDPENAALWTATMEGVAVEGIQYEYKATANGRWGAYELPMEGNQNFIFGTEEYPAGNYDLTFTADTENHLLTLDVKPSVVTAINAVSIDWNDGNTYNLNGQRLTQPVKGIVIRNGKKMVVK